MIAAADSLTVAQLGDTALDYTQERRYSSESYYMVSSSVLGRAIAVTAHP